MGVTHSNQDEVTTHHKSSANPKIQREGSFNRSQNAKLPRINSQASNLTENDREKNNI